MSGLFAGGNPAGEQIVTGSTAPPLTIAPSTTTTAPATTTTAGQATTTAPPPTVTTAAPPPTTAVSVAPTTVTTVPVQTTVSTTTTIVTVPTQLVVGIASGALGCVFQPPAATVRQGSVVRFRNDTPGGITIVFPNLGAATTINVNAGATSGPLPVTTPGTFTVTCTPGGDAIVGRMTLTVTPA